ncbi:MAG: sodium ion-translocating decarboxylase subunit beta [Clostridia bacterium]|nr:sodium ion-translocating decarboxylase subunit beta [Clostridia bacterium]
MILVSFVLMYLAIVKKFEPLLLLPIAFGMFLINLPGAYDVVWGTYPDAVVISSPEMLTEYIVSESYSQLRLDGDVWQYLSDGVWQPLTEDALKSLNLTEIFAFKDGVLLYNGVDLVDGIWSYNSTPMTKEVWSELALPQTFSLENGSIIYEAAHTYENVQNRGLLWYLFYGVQNVIFPPLIFLGIGAMTDFGPLISNPKSMLLGAAAQLGVFLTLIAACAIGFNLAAACSIAIIGGADGPTAIYVTQKLAAYSMFNNNHTDLLSAIAVAAYSYMALIPIIQKPLMRWLVPKKERQIKMKPLRTVSKVEKIIFPIMVTLVCGILLPDAIPLLGMLMLGNLLKESGVCDRLSSQAQNGLMNTVTIFLGVSVGCKAYGETFLQLSTLGIIGLGLVAFAFGTIGGLLVGRLMCKLSKGKINPLIGSAGVSAVPMAARISEDVGREEDPSNHLLMHAMGPNVAGVIGSAIAAGFLLAIV